MLMRDILVAVDGSPDSDAAVDAAAYLCRKGEGRSTCSTSSPSAARSQVPSPASPDA